MSKYIFASLTTGKMVNVTGAWSKRVVPILLMSNWCVLCVLCNKPIRVSSPIPFKSQLRTRNAGFAIYTAELARAKTKCLSSEETIYRTSWIPPKPPEVKHADHLLRSQFKLPRGASSLEQMCFLGHMNTKQRCEIQSV